MKFQPGNPGGGRPTKYKPQYARQAYKLCLLGATDAQLADFFEVNESTINDWKKRQEPFFQALKKGKAIADAQIAEALFKRAKGYSHRDVHISNYKGQITITKLTKHYPPDTTAAIFWLKNRKPEAWRDKQEVEHSGEVKQFTGIEIVHPSAQKPVLDAVAGDQD